MGIFDFFKKTEAQKTTEETKGDACLGVLGFFPMKEKRETDCCDFGREFDSW